MKNKFFGLFLIAVAFVGCEDNEDNPYVPPLYHDLNDTYVVNCPEPPIEIMSNQDEESVRKGEKMLNYFKILQISDNLYYLYYESFKEGIFDGNQGLYFAYSNDCKNWIRKFPDRTDDENAIFSSNIIGIDVVRVPDNDYPFRLFASKANNGSYLGLSMWKSKDGIKFEAEKELNIGHYDTQNAAVVRGDTINFYFRVWHNNGNRKIGFVKLDLDGNLLTSPYVLFDRNVYNSAASYLNSEYDVLFPTYFVTLPSKDYVPEIKVLISKGYDSKRIECSIGKWIGPNELWTLISPGIITINGEKYISYNTRNWLHDVEMPEGGVSKYKLIKIKIEKK